MTTTLKLEQVDPATLTVRDQAREDATPDDELIASIKAHGIIQPPVVEITSDGDWVIVAGHRRVGAAIAAGLTEITVIVRPALAGDDDGALTLEQQIVENERRKSLTAKDLANGYQRLTLFGLRPEDIAAQLGESADRVRAGLRIQKSGRAAELVASDPTIDLERAAQIADFDEHPKLQEKLVSAALTQPQNFDRDLAFARTQREVDMRIASLKSLLEDQDVPLVGVATYDESYWRGKDGKGKLIEKLDVRPEEHIECPGHAAIIHKAQSYYLNQQPADWIAYVCTDWEGNGHEAPASTRPVVEKTPEQIEREAELERARQAEQERRALIAANTAVRRTWITGHLTTGRLRPAAAHFDLLAAALRAELYHEEGGEDRLILEILDGTERPRPANWQDTSIVDELLDIITTGRVPALRIALARAFAYFEESHRFAAAAGVPYWTVLEALGYTLTDTDKTHQAAAVAAEAEWNADRAGEDLDADPREDDDTDVDEEGDDQ